MTSGGHNMEKTNKKKGSILDRSDWLDAERALWCLQAAAAPSYFSYCWPGGNSFLSGARLVRVTAGWIWSTESRPPLVDGALSDAAAATSTACTAEHPIIECSCFCPSDVARLQLEKEYLSIYSYIFTSF